MPVRVLDDVYRDHNTLFLQSFWSLLFLVACLGGGGAGEFYGDGAKEGLQFLSDLELGKWHVVHNFSPA